ncbi:MAG TPA: hypothetical protein VNK52_10015 [Hyphomicrobiaceae bacterium]|nr:hypothetical protein [Hyphomicrobiaceae bacterium]
MSKLRTWTLPVAACAALAAFAVSPALADAVKGKVEAVGNEGREVTIKTGDGKTFKASISGSRTNVMIGGKKAERSALKTGMECTVDAEKDGAEAKSVDCK